jgi:hypothetical protein
VTRIRRLGAVMLATPVAAGVAVLGVTAPAQAATGITAPGAETITKGSTVTVSARADNMLNAALQIAAPGSDDFETIASGGNLLGTTNLSKTVGIARNGVYQVRLAGGLTGATYDSRRFTVRVPPATPEGLRTSASGRKVVLRWKRGLESDLTGYKVAATGVKTRTGSTKDMCADTDCMTTITLPAGAAGQIPVFVKALRSDGAGGTVGSKVATSTVDLAGTTGGLPAGSPGLPGLPPGVPLNPLQTNAPITLPSVMPDGATPGFQYPAPAPEVAAPAQSAPAARNAAATTSLQWGKSLATALILLVVAAHLGTWTRRVRMAEARGGAARRRTPGDISERATGPDPAGSDPAGSALASPGSGSTGSATAGAARSGAARSGRAWSGAARSGFANAGPASSDQAQRLAQDTKVEATGTAPSTAPPTASPTASSSTVPPSVPGAGGQLPESEAPEAETQDRWAGHRDRIGRRAQVGHRATTKPSVRRGSGGAYRGRRRAR